MKTSFITKMEVRLTEEKSTLQKQIGEFSGKKDPGNSLGGVGWVDLGTKDDENAAEVAAYQDNLSLEKKLEQALTEVEAALTRIAGGTYGICLKCGKNIEEKRLEAFPAATQHTGC